jgi:hypothetical protein
MKARTIIWMFVVSMVTWVGVVALLPVLVPGF